MARENKSINEREMKPSRINHPIHYNRGKLEVIEVIEDWGLDFHLGNVLKYIARAQYKNNELEDLKKAKWYIERKIEVLENVKRT